MAHAFQSWLSYSNFVSGVKKNKCDARSEDEIAFLDGLASTSGSRETLIPTGTILWRAQLGFSVGTLMDDIPRYGKPTPHPFGRMKPFSRATKDGRLNRAGTPSTLYLATDERTALSEVRPWIGSYVSIAQFKILRDVRVIDCSSEYLEGFRWYDQEIEDPQDRERAVWRDLCSSISEPVSAENQASEYIPTQLVAEHFRELKLDGIMYNSLVGGGKNIALFNCDTADPISCCLHYVSSLVPIYDEVVAPKTAGD